MNAFIEKILLGLGGGLIAVIIAAAFVLHFLLFFAGLWALFLVLGVTIMLATTPEVLQDAHLASLILHFKPGSMLFSCLCFGSLSLAIWHWINSSIHRRRTS